MSRIRSIAVCLSGLLGTAAAATHAEADMVGQMQLDLLSDQTRTIGAGVGVRIAGHLILGGNLALARLAESEEADIGTETQTDWQSQSAAATAFFPELQARVLLGQLGVAQLAPYLQLKVGRQFNSSSADDDFGRCVDGSCVSDSPVDPAAPSGQLTPFEAELSKQLPKFDRDVQSPWFVSGGVGGEYFLNRHMGLAFEIGAQYVYTRATIDVQADHNGTIAVYRQKVRRGELALPYGLVSINLYFGGIEPQALARQSETRPMTVAPAPATVAPIAAAVAAPVALPVPPAPQAVADPAPLPEHAAEDETPNLASP